MSVDVLMKDNEAVGVNILTKVYCRLDTKCRLQSGCKMQTENLKSFFVWYVITCHLTTYRASRNRFSAISFHDYLHYCGIFLDHLQIKINLNIISSPRIVFSLCARVGWCDACTDFTNVIKVDVDVTVDVNKMSLLNIEHTQHSRNN